MDMQAYEKIEESEKEIIAIVNDFENCGSHGTCEKCKCSEMLNGTQCTICGLLLRYRNDLADRITQVIDEM